MNGISPNWNATTEEIKDFLLARGIGNIQRMAGFVPEKTSQKIEPVDISKHSGGILNNGIIDTYWVRTWNGAEFVDVYHWNDGTITYQDDDIPF